MSTQLYNNQTDYRKDEQSLLSRGFALTYAFFAYAVGAGMLFWFFFAAIGLAPYSLSSIETGNFFQAMTINTLLVVIFAVQHTIMARKSFKQKWTQVIPAHLERSTFVLAAGICMGLILWFWQPLTGNVWAFENETIRFALIGLAFAGVVYVLITSLVTNHFELFGIRQAWLHATGKPYTPLTFKRQWVYKYSRHPMMLGLLVVIWSTPDMSVTRLVLAMLLTVYLFIGIQFEEHGLIQEFGDKYQQYRKEIGMFLTFRKND